MIPVNLEFLLHAPQPLLSMGVPTIKDQFWIPELIIKYHQSHARASFTDPLVLWDFVKFFPAREIFFRDDPVDIGTNDRTICWGEHGLPLSIADKINPSNFRVFG